MPTPVIDALMDRAQRPVIQQQVQRSPLIAQALLAQGMSGEPVDSFWETAGRLAQTWAGNRLQGQEVAAAEAEQQQQSDELAEIMASMSLPPEQAALIRQMEPDQQIATLAGMFGGTEPTEYGFTNVDGTLLATDSRAGTATPVYTAPAEAPAPDWERVSLAGGPNGEEGNWEYFVDPANPQNLQPIGPADVTGPLATASASVNGGGNVPPGFEAVDRAFADTYSDWVGAGGFADVEKQITQLQGTLDALAEGNVTGPLIGMVPNWALLWANPEAVAVRDQVEEVVQRNLRLILGAQFTQEEGVRLIARAFNASLGEEENARRITRLINQMRTAAAATQAAVDYFATNGTLWGYTGPRPTLGDLEAAIEGEGGQPGQPQGALAPGNYEYDPVTRELRRVSP